MLLEIDRICTLKADRSSFLVPTEITETDFTRSTQQELVSLAAVFSVDTKNVTTLKTAAKETKQE